MTKLRLTDNRVMTDRVVAAIREAIYDRSLAPGERLQEERLAAQLGSSRGPVREAFLKLETEGLLIREPYRGARVAIPSKQVITDTSAIREVLESLATRLATPHMRPEDIERLEQVIARRKSPEAQGKAGEEDLNLGFHEIIWERCPNRRLTALLAQLWNQFPKATWRLQPGAIQTERALRATAEYEAILAAIKEGIPEKAGAEMAAHVRHGLRDLITLLDENPSLEAKPPERATVFLKSIDSVVNS